MSAKSEITQEQETSLNHDLPPLDVVKGLKEIMTPTKPAASETPETDRAEIKGKRLSLSGGAFISYETGMVSIEFARSLECRLREAKKDVNDLNNLLRAAGWGQGEIDSAAVVIERAEAAELAREGMVIAAWIEHHKGGDNLVWDETRLPCTPLYRQQGGK